MLRLLAIPVLLIALEPAIVGAWEVDGRTLNVPEVGCAIDAPGDDWRWRERTAPASDGSSKAFSCLHAKPPAREFLLILQRRDGRDVNQETMTIYADALGKWAVDDRFTTFVQSVDHSWAPWEGSWQLRIRTTHRESGRELWIIAYVGATAHTLYTLVALSDAPDESIDFGKYVQSFRLVTPEPDTLPPPVNGSEHEAPGSQPAVEFFQSSAAVDIGTDPEPVTASVDPLPGIAMAVGAFVIGFGLAVGLSGTVRLNPGIISLVAVAGVSGTRLVLARNAAHPTLSWSVVLEPLLPEIGVAVVLVVIAASIVPRYRLPKSRPRSAPATQAAATAVRSPRPGFDTATIQSATGFDTGKLPQHPNDFRPPDKVGHVGDVSTPDRLPASQSVQADDPDPDDIANAPGF